jgi:DnaK suppressor protein
MPAKKPAARTGKPKKAATKRVATKKAATKRVAKKKAAARKPAASKAKPKTAAVRKAPAGSPKKKPGKATAKPRKPAPRKAAKPAKAKRGAKTVAKQKVTASRSSAKAAPAKAPAKPRTTAKAAPRKTEPKAVKAPRRAAAAPRKLARTAKAVAMPSKARQIEAVAEDDEGYEFEGRHDLLTGPRNVKPYVQRRGETYMSTAQLEHFRTILSSWKRDLMEEVDRTVTHMKDEAANPPDPNDRATLESEFALELRTRDRERKLIRKIDEALKRIDDGSYGFCLETGEPIGVKRLEARPVATLCIEAQERRERRERQYGDRDDWYR